jgi:peptide/nickel transport system substrate-binding protein
MVRGRAFILSSRAALRPREATARRSRPPLAPNPRFMSDHVRSCAPASAPLPAPRIRLHPLAGWTLGALGLTSLAACSSGDWTPPPAAPAPAPKVDVEQVLDLMEDRGVFVYEHEYADGTRVLLDRRPGGAVAPMMAAPWNLGAQAGAAPQQPAASTNLASGTSGRESGPSGSRRSSADQDAGSVAEVRGPGDQPADVFHPDKDVPVTPLYGGRVIVHMASLPKHTNYVTENSAYTRRMLYELHETLLHQDWEWHDLRPRVARDYATEDMLILTPEAAASYPNARELSVRPLGNEEPFAASVLYGQVTEVGDVYRVTPSTTGGSATTEPVDVPVGDALAVERGTVFTFYLRPDVLWQPAVGDADGEDYDIRDQYVDAEDVYFSWAVYNNPQVDCDEKRFQFKKISDAEIVDDLTVRFFYQEQYYSALDSIGRSLTLLPSHLYNLADADNPWHDPGASASAQAKHVNENPHNQMWVGLGPYQVSEWNQQYVEAERFEGYFDPENGGYFDTIRYRVIDNDETAMNALLNGELDYFERVKSSDYFGARTQSEAFTRNFVKGYKYLGNYGYTCWNTQRSKFSDKRVRQALAHAFDADTFLRDNYKNLARQITGPIPYSSAGYNHDVEPFPFDPDRAIELLEEAGWIDTDGDGVVDKDGEALEIEFMMPSGNDASKTLGQFLQEAFERIGVRLSITEREWATFLEQMKSRDFDAVNLAWVPDLESDPEQVWHSKWGAPDVKSSNNSGIQEPELDAIILEGQRELDREQRQEVWKRLHAYVYDWQPYLFGYNVPRKFAINKKIRGMELFAVDPGYSVRRWYYVDPSVPGTRATR